MKFNPDAYTVAPFIIHGRLSACSRPSFCCDLYTKSPSFSISSGVRIVS